MTDLNQQQADMSGDNLQPDRVFLSHIAEGIDDLVMKPKNLETFRKKIRPFAQMWEQHNKDTENAEKKLKEHWQKVKNNPAWQSKKAGPPKKGWEWDNHYLLCPYSDIGPIFEMPARYAPAVMAKLKDCIETNKKKLHTYNSTTVEYQRLEKTIAEQKQNLAYILTKLSDKNSGWISTKETRVPFLWFRYIRRYKGPREEKLFGCWRPRLEQIQPNPVEALITNKETGMLPPPVNPKQEYERYYVALTSIHDNMLTGVQSISDGIWPKKLAEAIWFRFTDGQPCGPDKGFIQIALGRVQADLASTKPAETVEKVEGDTNLEAERPRVFISYTHENEEHKKWVRLLAGDIVKNGIEVRLDQWDLRKGEDITLFMEEGMRWASRVLVILTPQYRLKSEKRTGGVGYESLVLTGDLSSDLRTTKYIGLLRSGTWETSVPVFLLTRNHIDFRNDEKYGDSLEELLRELHGVPKIVKPALGSNPFESSVVGDSDRKAHKMTVQKAVSPENFIIKEGKKAPIGSGAADIHISYKALVGTREQKNYALLVALTLRLPPTQGEWKLVLLWPDDVHVRRTQDLKYEEDRDFVGQSYKEFILHSQRRIWPGETVGVVGPGCGSELEYELDSKSMDGHWLEKRKVHYTLYLEDHVPVQGQVSLSEIILATTSLEAKQGKPKEQIDVSVGAFGAIRTTVKHQKQIELAEHPAKIWGKKKSDLGKILKIIGAVIGFLAALITILNYFT